MQTGMNQFTIDIRLVRGDQLLKQLLENLKKDHWQSLGAPSKISPRGVQIILRRVSVVFNERLFIYCIGV